MSDFALEQMVDALEKIANEVGESQFHGMIVKAIETCEHRPTIARFRRIAGLNNRLDTQQEAVAASWELVMRVVRRHLGRDGEGNAVIRARVVRVDGAFEEEPAPGIPDGVRRAVAAMGGWGALADSLPQWTGQRWAHWKELYRPSPEEVLLLTANPSTDLKVK